MNAGTMKGAGIRRQSVAVAVIRAVPVRRTHRAAMRHMRCAVDKPIDEAGRSWLLRRVASNRYNPVALAARQAAEVATGQEPSFLVEGKPAFINDFVIDDLAVFDDSTLASLGDGGSFGLSIDDLARAMTTAPAELVERLLSALLPDLRARVARESCHTLSPEAAEAARRRALDALFWELTYWKTPELYEELTAGERLHPGIFPALAPDLRGRTVLDAGAGSGRATFACLRHGAERVYAVEPSPGLRRILTEKAARHARADWIVPLAGRFHHLPLEDNSVDVTISCSAFTADPDQGGELGLAEMVRVTRPNGIIAIIWPRASDYDWLAGHGFRYVALPVREEMTVRFRSLQSATRCVERFYARNPAAVRYLHTHRRRELPFSVLGLNPPLDYCWRRVDYEHPARVQE